jgi:polysaccharide chain length determinant protein (PEP-CTERM system associated)
MLKEVEWSNLGWNDYWTIAVRQRWFLLGPFFALGLLGFAAALIWPERYRSEALILVEQQKVPEQYVTPNVVGNLQDRLQSMKEQILSRTRLQHLIEQFDLYPKGRAGMTTTELVEMMRKDITIEPEKGPTQTGELTAFRITYIAPEAKVAQQVVNELTSLCIADNLRARDQQSTDTTQFLKNQLADARQRLAETEQRLRDYKMAYLGELPEQEQSNLQILSSLEAQLNAASAELDRLEQDKTYLESMKAGYKSLGPAVSSHPGDASRPESLPDLRAKLADLQAKYTDRYPEVISTKEEIARLQAIQQQQQKSSEEDDSVKSGGADAPIGDSTQPGQIEMDSRLKAVRVDIEDRQKEVASLRQKIRSTEAHLNLIPVREQQLAEVSRDYDNAKTQYQSLLQKESQSALATNLEKRQEGEQFRIIDPASLPEKPVKPNRAEISFGGWLLGLMAGIGLAALKEVANTRLDGEEDVSKVSPLPILVSIPDLPSPWKDAVASRNRLIEALTATLLLVTSLSFGAYFYYWVK